MTIALSVAINTFPPLQFSCVFASSFAHLHLPLRICNCLCAHLPLHVCICPCKSALKFAIARYNCRTLLAVYSWSIIITELCLRSTRSQTSLQDFACNPPLIKPHCRTLSAIYLWSIIFVQLSLSNPAVQLGLTCNCPICPQPIHNLPKYPPHSELCPFTLSIPSPIS